jgi:putative transposase
MRLPLRVPLRGHQLVRLEGLYRQTRCARTRLRLQMVLLSDAGYSVEEIAYITRQSEYTVRRWLHRFLEEGWRGLYEAPHSGRPPEITPAIEQGLRACVVKSPRDSGVSRPTWTTADLAQVVQRRFKIEVTDECIRQHLERVDIVCRRPTWTVKHLGKAKPGYAQKKGYHSALKPSAAWG